MPRILDDFHTSEFNAIFPSHRDASQCKVARSGQPVPRLWIKSNQCASHNRARSYMFPHVSMKPRRKIFSSWFVGNLHVAMCLPLAARIFLMRSVGSLTTRVFHDTKIASSGMSELPICPVGSKVSQSRRLPCQHPQLAGLAFRSPKSGTSVICELLSTHNRCPRVLHDSGCSVRSRIFPTVRIIYTCTV